jgi:small multidrug resistance family-3 protein
MRHSRHGFGPGVKPPHRWQELARNKQQELDDQIARLKAMRRLVDRVLHCDCFRSLGMRLHCGVRHGVGLAMRSLPWYLVAALGKIAGCFSFWAWLRMGKSPLWTVPGVAALILFTLYAGPDTNRFASARRAYAAYGGIYILSLPLWLWAWRTRARRDSLSLV